LAALRIVNLARKPLPPAHRNPSPETVLAYCALLALVLICGLAFLPSSSVLAERTALLFVGIGCAIVCWSPLQRHLLISSERAAFVLTAAMFVIYGLARAVGPEEGPALHFAALPDDSFVIPYSAYIVVSGAIISAPYWWFHKSTWIRSLIAGGVLLGLFTLLTFSLLRRHFPVGPLEILDPTPLPRMAMYLVEYCSLALLCHAVAARTTTRRLALRALPAVLLLLWIRHQFFMAPEESE
jgi:hypothetical protein